MNVDPSALVFLGDPFLDHGVKVAEEGVVPNEQMGFRTESVEHAGHFYGNVTCTHQSDFLGLFLEFEEAVGSDAQLATGDILGDIGMATSGEEDLFGPDGLLTTITEVHFDFIFREQVGAPVEIFHLVLFKVFFEDPIQTFDVGVTFLLEGFPVKRGCFFDGEAICCSLVNGLGYGSGVPSNFLRDASSFSSAPQPRLRDVLEIQTRHSHKFPLTDCFPLQ